MNDFLNKIGLLNKDGKVSVTNVVVYAFVFITAFRSLFSGLVFQNNLVNWKIESLDLASTLPLLFSLMNYGHKRMEINKHTSSEKVE